MATEPPRDNELEAILEKVRQVRNFDFRNYKRATLQRTNRELAHRTQEMDALSFVQRTIIRTLCAHAREP